MPTVKCNAPCPHTHRAGFRCRCLCDVGHRGPCVFDCGRTEESR
jgi:hypothetical protein